jgi:hypothetical protein
MAYAMWMLEMCDGWMLSLQDAGKMGATTSIILWYMTLNPVVG